MSNEENKTNEDYEYKLWKFFKDEHELILLESQIDDIVREVEKYQLEQKIKIDIDLFKVEIALPKCTCGKLMNVERFMCECGCLTDA